MGWIATIIMLYGSFLVGEKNKTGFLCQIAGNLLWAWVGATRGMQVDLIVVSLAFVALYVRNYVVWFKCDKNRRAVRGIRVLHAGRAFGRPSRRSHPCD